MFQPGQSGNPGGRPKGEAKVRDAAREHTDAALKVLVDALADDDKRISMKAAELLLDRGWGKAPVSVEMGSDPDKPLVHRIEQHIVDVTRDPPR